MFDVTKEYEKRAAPKTGSILFGDGYITKHHTEEIRIAEWLHDTYGSDITLVAESRDRGEKRPDYIWQRKMWELKSSSSEKAIDSAVRSALKQIDKNPGGIILDFGDNSISLEIARESIGKRLARNSDFVVDVILRANDGVLQILRYDGRKKRGVEPPPDLGRGAPLMYYISYFKKECKCFSR